MVRLMQTQTEINGVVVRLRKVSRTEGGWKALCPAHDDNHPSLSVTEGDNGRVLLYCHAGCSTESVLRAIGLSFRDLFSRLV